MPITLLIDSNIKFSVRAALNGILETLINFGFIVCFLLGNYFHFWEQAKIYLIVPTIAAIILFILPESPVHLAKNGKDQVIFSLKCNQCVSFKLIFHLLYGQQAKKAYNFYKGNENEFDSKKSANFELGTESNVDTTNKSSEPNPRLTMRDFSKFFAFI